MNAEQKLTPPAIGQIWPGQGGIYGGLRQYPEGLCHIIFAAEDIPGRHEYGGYGVSVEAESRTDGLLNTLNMLRSALEEERRAEEALRDLLERIPEDKRSMYPAVIAAASYTADGHKDFYLPAIGELHHAWQYLPESLATDWYYWSSTQSSAYYAYTMGFELGWLDFSVKDLERVARPVRRFLQ